MSANDGRTEQSTDVKGRSKGGLRCANVPFARRPLVWHLLGRHRIIHDQVVKSFEHRPGFGAVFRNDRDEAFQRQ